VELKIQPKIFANCLLHRDPLLLPLGPSAVSSGPNGRWRTVPLLAKEGLGEVDGMP